MKTLIIAGALALLGVSAASAASPAAEVRVTTHGLNLGDSADAQTMIKRLDNASLQACGASRFSLAEVRRATRNGDCYKGAMDGAVATLGAPVVSSLYRTEARAYAAR